MVNLSLVTEPISFGRNNTQIRKERERGGGEEKNENIQLKAREDLLKTDLTGRGI